MKEQYQLVIDTGTLEHCFNVGQAFMNVAVSVSIGGVILQAAPLNRFNHGFWSFSPTADHDFFKTTVLIYCIAWA